MRSKMSVVVLAVSLLVTAATSALAAQGWLGVTTQSTDADQRRDLDLTRDGLLVNSVSEDSPADRAGLRKGDVILSYDGRSVSEPNDLRSLVRNTEPGQSVNLSVWRNGSRRSLDVRVGELPGSEDEYFETPVPRAPEAPIPPRAPRAPRAPSTPDSDDDGTVHRKMIINGRELTEEEMEEKMKDSDGWFSPKEMKELEGLKDLKELKDLPGMRGWSNDGGRTFSFNSIGGRGRLGVRVEKLSDDLAQALGVGGDEGVLVVQVIEDTPAQRAGLRAGDVIVRVGNDTVSDPDALVRALGERNGTVDIVVLRKGVRRTIQADLERGTAPRAFSVNPNIRPNLRNRELDRTPQVYRWRAKDDADKENQDLREELRQLRRELQELRREMGERR